MEFPSAAELNLWDYEPPEGMALSVFPPAREHFWDPMWWDQGGRDPLDQKFIFRMQAGPERTEKLKKLVQEYPRYGPKMYEKCANAGRADIIRELLRLNASMDISEAKRENEDLDEDEDGEDVPMADMEPALIEAANEGHFECVKVLVQEANVDINLRDERDSTAVTNAAARGHGDIVVWLLARGAEITFERDGLNDLEAAVRSGKVDILKNILANQQSIARDFKLAPQHLRIAAHSDSMDMVKFVLEGANFPPTPSLSANGNMELEPPTLTPEQKEAILETLPEATSSSQAEMLQLLLSYITPRRADGTLEFFQLDEAGAAAVFNGTEDAMENATDIPALFELAWETLLCPPQADLDTSEKARERRHDWLHRRLISACAEGCPQTVKLICEKYGANVNHVSHKFFSTPLGRAAASSKNPYPPRLQITRYLLERGDVDIHLACGEYANGITPLGLAVLEGQKLPEGRKQIEMLKLLLDHGGPVEDVNETLLQQAKALEPDGNVPVYVVLFQDEPRFPVRLMTGEGYNLASASHKTSMVTFDADTKGIERLIGNIQIRKRDSILAASDPKGRPLNKNKD